ncbi:MAG TPA: DEAD/DEAH box helicase [Actinocrinis sp.]|nr:DEAD/DEAH box helicase [Actinocrinis sp.]
MPFDQEVCTTMSVDTTTTTDAPSADAANTDIEIAAHEIEAAQIETAANDAAESETDAAQTASAETETANRLDTGTEVTFASLDLPKPLVEVLTEAGVVTAFPIQAATIPDALVGRDVMGRGRTGSGKTLAFGLPTLARLEGLRAKPRKPLALVLVPTRELAMQVEDSLRPYARAMRLRIRSVYGGAPMRKQIDNLRYGVELLVATPGRLSDLIEQGECELGEVDIAILDEADQMCDMGFLPHVCELMDQVAEGGQRLLFSATLDGAVDEIVKKYMNDPALHEVDPHAGVVSTMSHHLLMVTPQHKAKVAAQIAGRHAAEAGNGDARSLFFVRTQMAVDRVTEQMRERGLPAAGLHGGMTQVARTKTLEDFKEGRTPVLIATDVAARGIHVDGIDLVVHLDPPRDSKDYLHRAGRTARAGQAGVVASLILPKQRKQAQRLMDDAGVTAAELDAAPIGTGGKWERAGTAMAELTGAREVPEPGDVPVFTVPMRERRDGRGGRDGDRFGRGGYNRGDRFERRDRGFDRPDRDGRGGDRDRGDRFGRDRFERGERGDSRGGAPFRRDSERGGFERRDSDRGGFHRRDGERGGFERRDFRRDGNGPRDAGSGFQGRRFERRDGEQSGRDERRDGSFGRRDRGFEGGGDQRRSFGDGQRRGFENRGSDSRGAESRGAEGRGSADGRGFAGRSDERGDRGQRFEKRGFEGRGFENRGSEGRSSEGRSFEGHRSGGRDFRDRARDERGGFDRNRGADRFQRDDRHGQQGDRRTFGGRPGQDRDRGAARRPSN